MNLQESIRNDLNKIDEAELDNRYYPYSSYEEYSRAKAVYDGLSEKEKDEGGYAHPDDIIDSEETSEIDFNSLIQKSIDELELSVRASNILKAQEIYHVGDLIQKDEQFLIRQPNFHRKVMAEIKSKLDELGLQLGTDVSNYQPAGYQPAGMYNPR